ncbi:unnamed protein product [Camellia sinensis]
MASHRHPLIRDEITVQKLTSQDHTPPTPFHLYISSFKFQSPIVLLTNTPIHFLSSRPSTLNSQLSLTFTMSETPFRPRENLFEKQKYFQSMHKYTYLKGPMDKITSVAIPAALAASSLFLIHGASTICLMGLERKNDEVISAQQGSIAFRL